MITYFLFFKCFNPYMLPAATYVKPIMLLSLNNNMYIQF